MSSGRPGAEKPLLFVWIRQHHVANELVEVAARGQELAQRPARRREAVELLHRERALIVGAAEIREAAIEVVDDRWRDRMIDPRHNFDVTRRETLLPSRWR